MKTRTTLIKYLNVKVILLFTSMVIMSGCSMGPKNPSIVEVRENHYSDYRAIETYIGDSDIIIYIDVNKNDEHFKKFMSDKIELDKVMGKYLRTVDYKTRKKCRACDLLSSWYNPEDEYRRGNKLKKYSKCSGARIDNGFLRTKEVNNYVYVISEFHQEPNSDQGQNYFLFTTGIIKPKAVNPIIFAATEIRRSVNFGKEQDMNKRYLVAQVKAWSEQLDKYNVPYHVNMELIK